MVDGSQTLWQLEDLQTTESGNETEEEDEAIKNEWLNRKQASIKASAGSSTESYSFLEKYFEIQVSGEMDRLWECLDYHIW